jgi:hypothetical protein
VTREPLRFSHLKRIGQSPAHYRAAVEQDGSHLLKGSAVHSVLLGGKTVISYPGPVRRGKDWEAFQADHPEDLILSRSEIDDVSGMVRAVQSCPEAMRVLQGVRERTVMFTLQGRECRATPDVDGGIYVTELKTTRSSSPSRFAWDAVRHSYNGQLAWYQDALMLQPGRREAPEAAFIVAVESSAPYVVTVFRVAERALDQGRRTNRLWLETLLACEAANEWPGYSQSIVELDLPGDEMVIGEAEEAA